MRKRVKNNINIDNIMDQNLELLVCNKHFVTSAISIVELVLNKSKELETTNIIKSGDKSHTRLQNACMDVSMNYKNNFTTESTAVDHGKIIKKVYNVLKTNLSELSSKNNNLFAQRNEKNQIITIIPGVDIGLVVPYLTEDEKTNLWNYVHLLFISSVKMIFSINKHNREGKIWGTVEVLEKELSKTGIMINGSLFNPFVGVGDDTGELTADSVIENAQNVQTKSNSMLESLGVGSLGNMMDMNKLNDQLKNISQEEIDIATKNIAELLGAGNDSDVKDVCSTLVSNIVTDLKENGLQNMFATASSVSAKIKGKIDMNKMKKTTGMVVDFMKNSDEKLSKMKDEKGNPIGSNLLKQLSIPLQMAKMFGQDKNTSIPTPETPKKKKR